MKLFPPETRATPLSGVSRSAREKNFSFFNSWLPDASRCDSEQTPRSLRERYSSSRIPTTAFRPTAHSPQPTFFTAHRQLPTAHILPGYRLQTRNYSLMIFDTALKRSPSAIRSSSKIDISVLVGMPPAFSIQRMPRSRLSSLLEETASVTRCTL